MSNFWRFSIAHNEKGLWKLGNLKTSRPNVRRYKLLMFNYLQMFGSFRPPKQKYKRIPKVQSLPSAPIATILCWWQCFLSSNDVSMSEKLSVQSRLNMQKVVQGQQNQVFKSRPKLRSNSPRIISQFLFF